MDGSFSLGDCCAEPEGARVEIVVKEGEKVIGLFDPDEIAKGRRVECDSLGSGTYYGVRTEVFYGYGPDPSRAFCIIVSIPKPDGTCEKRCKLTRTWDADEKRGRLEIYDI